MKFWSNQRIFNFSKPITVALLFVQAFFFNFCFKLVRFKFVPRILKCFFNSNESNNHRILKEFFADTKDRHSWIFQKNYPTYNCDLFQKNNRVLKNLNFCWYSRAISMNFNLFSKTHTFFFKGLLQVRLRDFKNPICTRAIIVYILKKII